MSMKVIKVSELKANLSRYLRLASRGEKVIVNDRDDPIAQIVPPDPAVLPWRERMAREGRLRLGSQNWEDLRITALGDSIDIQSALTAVRED